MNVHVLACIIYCDNVDLHSFVYVCTVNTYPHSHTLTASHTHTLTASHPHSLIHPPADGRVLKTIFATDTSSGSNILPIFPIVAEEIQVRRYVCTYKNNAVYHFTVHSQCIASKLNIGAKVWKLSFAWICDASMDVFIVAIVIVCLFMVVCCLLPYMVWYRKCFPVPDTLIKLCVFAIII